MKAIIIDDEPIARQGISILAKQVPFLEICGEFGNPLLAQEYIVIHPDLDLIFINSISPKDSFIYFLSDLIYMKSS